MQKVISTDKAPGAIGPYSQAIEVNGMVFTSGVIPVNPATGVIPEGVEAQATQAFTNLTNLVEASGAAMSQAVDEDQQHKVQEALDWFAAKMSVFSKEEQETINACAIAFAERDQMVIPKVNIAVNAKCSQADLMTYASSAFFKIGQKRKDIARFLSIVFEAYFPGGEGFVYKKMPGVKGQLEILKKRL